MNEQEVNKKFDDIIQPKSNQSNCEGKAPSSEVS
jgi:hypothetical protein